MNDFTYSYPMKVYFGEGAAKKAIAAELGRFGKVVMLAYGGGSIKKSGVYEEIKTLLLDAGKEIVEFSGIMPNPTYIKVQEGAVLARERSVDFILAVGGGSVIGRHSDGRSCDGFGHWSGNERRSGHHARRKAVERSGLWNSGHLCRS